MVARESTNILLTTSQRAPALSPPTFQHRKFIFAIFMVDQSDQHDQEQLPHTSMSSAGITSTSCVGTPSGTTILNNRASSKISSLDSSFLNISLSLAQFHQFPNQMIDLKHRSCLHARRLAASPRLCQSATDGVGRGRMKSTRSCSGHHLHRRHHCYNNSPHSKLHASSQHKRSTRFLGSLRNLGFFWGLLLPFHSITL